MRTLDAIDSASALDVRSAVSSLELPSLDDRIRNRSVEIRLIGLRSRRGGFDEVGGLAGRGGREGR